MCPASDGAVELIAADASVRSAIFSFVPEVVAEDLVDDSLPTHHDSAKLERALAGILDVASGEAS